MTRQKGASLLHYYVLKQVFSWCNQEVQYKVYMWCLITFRSRFSHDAPKTLIFDALIRRKACFLMTRQKLLYLPHYYVEKQIFSWHAKKGASLLHYYVLKQVFSWRNQEVQYKVYIWCLITFRSRFSNGPPKKLVFDALLRGKAGFLMTRQKGANLLHYYVLKQVYSWRAKKVQICCIITC